ncbi:MAG TPA: VOC family protein [Gemmatimonadaceae bacterium]|nr:VOC family protein [Gemmatimonadaceae bacterium]
MHGQFVWYELLTPDTDAAKRFYASLTGWGTQPFDKDYTMWTTAGAPFAGLYRLGPEMRQQGVPPNWMPYVESSNVDETVRLATSLGGAVTVPASDIPNVGRFAVLRDPQGATFGVYRTSGPSMSWDGTPVLGRFSWHELMTTDYRKAFDFYQKLFGWEKTGEMDMGGGNAYLMYGKGQPFGGIFNRHGDMMSMPPFWMVYIYVKDVRKAVEIAKKNGASVHRPPMEIPGGGTIAILADPQGAAFALHAAPATSSGSGSGSGTAERKGKSGSKSRGGAKKSARPAAKKAGATQKRSATKKRGGAKKVSATKKRPTAKKRGGAKKGRATTKRGAAKKGRRR